MNTSALGRLVAATALLQLALPAAGGAAFREVDLVSDVPGRAKITDSNLVNPWGLVPGRTGVFWASDNAKGLSTLYRPDGTIVNLVVGIPGGLPTGVVAPDASGPAFEIPTDSTALNAAFIFVGQSGVVSAWSPAHPESAIGVASHPGAIYTGAALAAGPSGPNLYAADFRHFRIDVFDRHFASVDLGSGAFHDPNLPPGYTPFNIAGIGGQLYVAYALASADSEDEVAGPGQGYVDIYNPNGHLVKRFASGDSLNAPWGMVEAPPGFGPLGGAILVGNFGNGMINAFKASNGSLIATLPDTTGHPIVIPGLWGLHFGSPASGDTVAHRLYFAAGIDDESHGLFGFLAPVAPRVSPPGCEGDHARSLAFWSKQCGSGHEHGDDDGDDDGDHGHGHGHGDGQGDDHHHKGPHRHGSDEGDGDNEGHGHGHSIPADSLDALFACVKSTSHAFGSSGCFTAGCDLLTDHEDVGARERAARQFLVLLLDRCAGLVCDSTRIDCGDDDGGPATVGDVIAFLDTSLCRTSASSKGLASLASCATHIRRGDSDDDDEDGEDPGGGDAAGSDLAAGKIQVKPLGNPHRIGSGAALFQMSTIAPSVVRFRIYDAAGRFVAEPLHDFTVNGSIEVRWDGLNSRGLPAPSGAYFYRATSPTASATGRFVIMR